MRKICPVEEQFAPIQRSVCRPTVFSQILVVAEKISISDYFICIGYGGLDDIITNYSLHRQM